MTERFGEVTLSRAAEIVAVAARLPIPKVFAAIGSGGRLVQSGLLVISNDRSDLDSKFELKSELLDLVSAPSLDRDALLARFVEPAPPSTLTAQDFAHVAGAVADVVALLHAATRHRSHEAAATSSRISVSPSQQRRSRNPNSRHSSPAPFARGASRRPRRRVSSASTSRRSRSCCAAA